ncbi:hypothetical protein [Pseudoduganella umbonata]|uniref:Uncharacterized protein n=1 Tax=Pseudoduganella umbonata TaxID=864828 RepID=A0A4V1EED0_9BURK|nr:hypothetical protein [Pseudoduganella umbonata]MBB3223966.1 hypothetical protein [Pseudoduganella umbonata]QCP14151.1 hypothetical protein FCL38_29860 [Pseudoduganella umbonata]
MTTPRKPSNDADKRVVAETNKDDAQSRGLDEALDESFPASDPVAVSITTVVPPKRTEGAPDVAAPPGIA